MAGLIRPANQAFSGPLWARLPARKPSSMQAGTVNSAQRTRLGGNCPWEASAVIESPRGPAIRPLRILAGLLRPHKQASLRRASAGWRSISRCRDQELDVALRPGDGALDDPLHRPAQPF